MHSSTTHWSRWHGSLFRRTSEYENITVRKSVGHKKYTSEPCISGFLITDPIWLRACEAAFCTFKWGSVKTSRRRGTMLGRQDDNCFGAQ